MDWNSLRRTEEAPPWAGSVAAPRQPAGFALLLVLLVLLLLAAAAAVLSQRTAVRSAIAVNRVRAIQRQFGQRAATQAALLRLSREPGWRTVTAGEEYPFDGLTYRVTVRDDHHPGCGQVIAVTVAAPGAARAMRTILGIDTSVWVADTGNNRIRFVDRRTGIISTAAGCGLADLAVDDVPAAEGQIKAPQGVFTDGYGSIFIADTGFHRIRKVDARTGIITTVAGNGIAGFDGDGGPATEAMIKGPQGVCVDPHGNIYIADTWNSRIRRVDATTGLITTMAGLEQGGYSGDGGLAVNAKVKLPQGLSIDAARNLYIADTKNSVIRKIDGFSGIITTVAGRAAPGYLGDGGLATEARLKLPEDVAVDDAGNLYIADTHNHVVRRVDAGTGVITTYAGTGLTEFLRDGGPATNADLKLPEGVSVDPAGNLYIADTGHDRIRRVDAATGIITTVAGTGVSDYGGDGGPAVAAWLKQPCSIRYWVSFQRPVPNAY